VSVVIVMNSRTEAPSGAPMRAPALFVVWMLSLVLTAGVAHASHYAFERVDFVTAKEKRQLSRAGILDTKVLLGWTATLDKRNWLSDQTGIDVGRLEELATMCDLLRIEGIGPSMVDVFQKAHVRTSDDLAYALPEPLLKDLQVAARGTRMAKLLPTTDTLQSWIREARQMRPVLHDLSPAY